MSNIKLITVTNQPERAEVLVRSAKKHGWDISVLEVEWRGFGTKLIATYEYLKAHPEVERFVFADAHDVVVFGTEEEFEGKIKDRSILLSCERGLWPPTLIPFRSCYPNYEHGFNYINSGLYYMQSYKFIELFELFPPFHEIDDQIWMNLVWLVHLKGYKYPDFEQTVFNSHSFIREGEYIYLNKRLQVVHWQTPGETTQVGIGHEPIFVHSNGRTVDPKLDELIKNMLA